MISAGFYERFARTLVLVISPHPDDSVLGAGGLVHRLTDPVAWSNAGMPEDDRPAVYTIVMTAGTRGVDDEYLRRFALGRIREKNPALADYLLRRTAGEPESREMEKELSVIRENVRRNESLAEGRLLRVRKSFFLNLRGMYEDHATSAEDRTVVKETMDDLIARHGDWDRLVLVPHRDDMHPVHKLSTSLVVDILESDLVWQGVTVWQYESPWITFTPHQVEIVVPFDGIAMATKSEAMAVHRSQEYRTKYSDVARYRAQMKAETFPELLGGFGYSGQPWDYVEAFQELRPVTVLETPSNLASDMA